MNQRTSPLISAEDAARGNRDIVWMTLPPLAIATFFFGLRPALLCVVAALTASLCDHLVSWLRAKPHDRQEGSSIATALVLTMLMPATVPYHVIIVSAATATLLGKHAFGGFGHYPFNPSAFGYAVAAVSWPEHVFVYPAPFAKLSLFGANNVPLAEGFSHTLRAGGVPNVSLLDLVLGNYAGPIGATSVLVLITCAMFLWMRRDITLGLPFGFLLSCGLVAWFYPRVNTLGLEPPWLYIDIRFLSLQYELLSGSLVFAAVFLINEPCTRPRNPRAHFAYGMFLGFLTMMFRYFGIYDTGVCFAVLAANALTGYLDRLFDGGLFRSFKRRRAHE